MKLCKCGCETEISEKATWVIGHQRKGKSWNRGLIKENHPGLKSQSEKVSGKPSWNLGMTGQLSHMFGKSNSKGKHFNCGVNNGMFGKPSPRRGVTLSERTKQKISNSKLGKTPNVSTDGKKRQLEGTLKNLPKLLASDKNWNDPVRNKKISDSKKEQWKDIEWKEAVLKKVFESNEIKPNKLELQFQAFLDKQFPGEWKYVGNGQIWIAGKCPDFWNMNGRKTVIELFGTYWHKPEDEEIRKVHFGKYGYETIIVWDHELSNKPLLLEKLT